MLSLWRFTVACEGMLMESNKFRQYIYMQSLTFLASTFLNPFGIGYVIVAGFTVKQRPTEEKPEFHVRRL